MIVAPIKELSAAVNIPESLSVVVLPAEASAAVSPIETLPKLNSSKTSNLKVQALLLAPAVLDIAIPIVSMFSPIAFILIQILSSS